MTPLQSIIAAAIVLIGGVVLTVLGFGEVGGPLIGLAAGVLAPSGIVQQRSG